jgi:hypothetical protein
MKKPTVKPVPKVKRIPVVTEVYRGPAAGTVRLMAALYESARSGVTEPTLLWIAPEDKP